MMRKGILAYAQFLLLAAMAGCYAESAEEDIGTAESPIVGPPRTAADVGLDLGLPFDLTQPHVVSQTYCPNNLTPQGTQCFSHSDHGSSWSGLGDDQYAIDFAGIGVSGNNTRVLSVAAGTVEIRAWTGGDDWNSGWGRHVHVRHSNGCLSHYGHLNSRAVTNGQVVQKGQLLGYEGMTGNVTGPHIHFALHCPTVSNPNVFEPVKPEPMGGYTNFWDIDMPLSQSSHWVTIGGNGATHFPVGTLVKQIGHPEIYLVCSESTVCHITDWNAFVGRRLWQDSSSPTAQVVEVPSDVLGCYAQGSDISSQQTTRLVACASELYVTFKSGTSALKRRIPFTQADARYQPLIKSWGFRSNELQAGTSEECNTMPSGPNLGLRVGTVVEESSDNDFWLVTADTITGNDATSTPTTRYQRLNREEWVSGLGRYAQLVYGTYRGYRNVIQIPDGTVAALSGAPLNNNVPFNYAKSIECHPGGQGGGVTSMTIDCRVSSAALDVTIAGPVQEGVFTQVTASGTLLEYGSDTDGWGAYTSGKPKAEWTGDWISTGIPKVYTLALNPSVQNMNFFLYNPSNGQQGWFDLNDWTVTGDCWRDGGGIRHATPPPAVGDISCTLDSNGLAVYVNGPVQSMLVSGSVTGPTKILYGSDTDGWTVPYSSGKAFTGWNGSNSHTLFLPPNVYNFNLYLTDGSSGKWFDLTDADYDGDSWTVGGACWKNGGVITHAAPPNGTINCVENGPDMTVTITGNIPYGIFGSVPSGSPVYLEYGSDTDGWGAYTSGKPKATWSSSTTSYSLILSNSVQNMNFFLYGPSSGQTSWFNLNSWNVVGDCWRDGGGIRH